MTNALTQTSRAAIVAAALAVPAMTLPALAQTPPPAGDATGTQPTAPETSTPETAAPETPAMDGAAPGTDAMPDAGQTGTGMDQTDMETTGTEGDSPAIDTPMGSGENTGSAAQSGSSADMDQLTYQRVVADLQSGRDFSDQLTGVGEDTTITVTPLSELEQQGGGALSTAETGTPPLTGGQTTNELAGDSAPQTQGSGASAGAAPDAPAGMADGMATGGGTDTAGMSMGTPGDIDMALEQAGDSLTTMRTALADHPQVTQALEDAGHDAQDVVALHRDGDELTVIVDDRDS